VLFNISQASPVHQHYLHNTTQDLTSEEVATLISIHRELEHEILQIQTYLHPSEEQRHAWAMRLQEARKELANLTKRSLRLL
jgi:hypothetical protein